VEEEEEKKEEEEEEGEVESEWQKEGNEYFKIDKIVKISIQFNLKTKSNKLFI
jgi:hypothetical protein